MVADKHIDVGFDSGDEAKNSIDIIPKMERIPNVIGVQELEETSKKFQAKNFKLRRLLREAEEEKQRLLR